VAIDLNKLKKELCKDELDTLLKIKKIFKDKKLKKDEITLFYPGCGDDIINPLLLSDALLSYKTVNLVLIDVELFNVMSYFRKNNIKFKSKRSKNKITVNIKTKTKTINLIHYAKDALSDWPAELQQGFDVYFERAFEICRRDDPFFVKRVLNNLNKDGLLISDCGFYDISVLKSNNLKQIKVPSNFGFYDNFKIFKKK
jgi:predicted GNAT superfamily acetyltransferase